MKSIEERAKAYAKKIWSGGQRDWATAQKMSEQDFIAGAKSERKELLQWDDQSEANDIIDSKEFRSAWGAFVKYLFKWHDPKVELPEEYTPVLVRYGHIETRKAVVWLMVTPQGRRVWNVDNSDMVILDKDIIGWRPIVELQK